AGLVTRRMRKGRGRLAGSARISVRHSSAPLSLEQERYWARCAAGADAATFNVALALRIAGQVDITTLRRAAEAVVNQQEILQVRFVTTVHGVRQLLSPRHRIRVRVHHFDYLARGQRAS